MELVDLTGIWRDGEFYKVNATNQCRGCEFYADPSDKNGKQCYDRLECEVVLHGVSRHIYIKTDPDSVAKYVAFRLTPEEAD